MQGTKFEYFSLHYNDLFEIKDGVFEISVALLSFKLIIFLFSHDFHP